MSPRLDALRELLADDPEDAFTRYALAMELKGLGQLDEALAEFGRLVQGAPDYVATYYQYARTLQSKGRVDEAIAMARRGVAVATDAGDDHTRDELEDLIADLQA
jgi:tetratricopeptide (TPR) repeat protein